MKLNYILSLALTSNELCNAAITFNSGLKNQHGLHLQDTNEFPVNNENIVKRAVANYQISNNDGGNTIRNESNKYKSHNYYKESLVASKTKNDPKTTTPSAARPTAKKQETVPTTSTSVSRPKPSSKAAKPNSGAVGGGSRVVAPAPAPVATTSAPAGTSSPASSNDSSKSKSKQPSPEDQFGEAIKTLPEFCKKDYHYIQNAIQLNQLQAECTIVKGNILILGYQEPVVDLGNINCILGDLIIEESSELLRVQGKNLKYIGRTFKLHDLTSVTEVELPKLSHFDSLYWRVVPILQTVVMEHTISSVRNVLISDTSLIAIEGFYGCEELDSLNINNNRYMDNIRTTVKRITTQLSISANSQNLQLEMPELESAENVTVRDASSVLFPKLEYVNESLELIENNFETLEIPNLKRIGGTFGLIDNQFLEKVNLSSVTTINGGLMISNNTKLSTFDFLPELTQVGGAIQFEGTIEDTSFPKLKLVKGSAKIDSGLGKLDCSKWTRPSSGNSIIRGGQLECTSAGRRNTVSVSKDGVVLDRDTTEVVPTVSMGNSMILDRSKLGKLVWSLGFGWMIFLLIFVTLQ